jgi:hypothetical protein
MISYQTISEGGEVEHSVYYNESAENIVKQYFQKLRVRRILGMLLICLATGEGRRGRKVFGTGDF